jgi:hypothetical protein
MLVRLRSREVNKGVVLERVKNKWASMGNVRKAAPKKVHPGLSLGRSLSSEEAQFVDRMDRLTATRLRAMEERLFKKMEASNRLISDMQAVQLKLLDRLHAQDQMGQQKQEVGRQALGPVLRTAVLNIAADI